MREEGKVSWEHKNLQFRTAPKLGVHARLSEQDLAELEPWQRDGWEVQRVVNIRGSYGFTAHLLFMLRREVGEATAN